MHASVLDFIRCWLTPEEVRGKRVLEIGSLDVNGSPRQVILPWSPAVYIGVDLRPGPGVDWVMDAGDLHLTDWADVVVCTETLEHCADWRRVVLSMKRALVPGGVLILTTRSPGYPRHDHPGDHWRWLPENLSAIFADFAIQHLAPDPEAPGVFLRAVKPVDWQPAAPVGEATPAPP